MKKLIAILLAVAMLATICVGCAKQDNKPDADKTNPTTNSTTNSTNDKTDTTEKDFVDKCENVSKKYNVIATYHISNGDESDIEDKFDEAMENKDFDTLNKFLSNFGQTVLMLPNNEKYTYDQEYDGCTIVDEDTQKMVELHLVPYMDEFEEIEEKGATKLDKLEYSSHSGQAYKWTYEDETMYVYLGFTKYNTVIGVIGNDFDFMKEIIDELIVIDSESSDVVTMDDKYMNDLSSKNETAAYIEDYQLILHCGNLKDYDCEPYEYGICLINKNTQDEIEIEVDDSDFVADEIADYMMSAENLEHIKCIDTQNVFGFAFQLDDEVCFYGFDKDSFGALIIEGDCSMDNMFDIVKAINVHKCAFSDEVLGQVEDSLVAKDESAVAELGNAILLALSDQFVWDEVMLYVCDGNVSSYVSESANLENSKVFYNCNHENKHYYHNADARLQAGMYSIAGHMKGVTITFYPTEKDGKCCYMIADGIINDFVKPSNTVQGREDIEVVYDGTAPDYEKYGTLSTMQDPSSNNKYLYNRIRAVVGDYIEISSSRYRDVPLTIFIAAESPEGFIYTVDHQFGGFTQD